MIPKGWKSAKLGDICDILDSKRVPLNQEQRRSRNGDVPYYGANGIVDYINSYIFDEPLLLMAEDGGYFDQYKSRPICQLIKGKSWINNHAHVLRVRESNEQAYVYYYFVHRDIQEFINGGTRSKLNQKDLKLLPIALPPLPEQKRIAEILTSVDDAIQATEKIIEQTKRVKQGLLQELLTRGIGHTKFKKTEIGEIPESWQFVTIDHVLESSTYGINKSLCENSSLTPILRMGNIQENKLSLKGLKYCDVADLNKEASFLRRNDIIFNRTNSYDLVGKVALIDTDSTLSYASYLIRLRTNDFADPQWLLELLGSVAMQSRLKSIATLGVSQCNINPTKMRSLKIPLPSIPEQNNMVQIFKKINAVLALNLDKINCLQTIKSGLMQDLLTGRVRTRGAS